MEAVVRQWIWSQNRRIIRCVAEIQMRSPRAPKHIRKANSLRKSSYDRLCCLRPSELHFAIQATCTSSPFHSPPRSKQTSPPRIPPSPSTTTPKAPKAPRPPEIRAIWLNSTPSRRLRACADRRACRSCRRARSRTARCCCCPR